MAIDKRIELEIALRDSVSLTLQNIADSLEGMSSKLSRGGESISQSAEVIKKIEVHTKGVGERAKESTKSLMGMGDSIKWLTLAMGVGGGPLVGVGIAVAAVAAAGKFMTGQARARLELKHMSEDTGISEDLISVMQRTGRSRGIPFEAVVKNIRQIGVNLNDMKQRGEGSDAFKHLADLGYANFGRELLEMLKAGNIDQAARAYFEQYEKILKEKGESAARLYATEGIKLPESFLKGYLAASAGIQPAYRVNLEYAEKWLKFMEGFDARVKRLGQGILGELARALIAMAYEGDTPEQKRKKLKSQITAPSITSAWWRRQLGLPALTEEQEKLLLDEKKESVKKQKALSEIIMGWRDNAALATSGSLGANPQSILRRQEGGPVTSGIGYLVGEKGPELFSGGGQYGLVGEGGPAVFRPGSSGNITKADLVRSYNTLEETARGYSPPERPDFVARVLDLHRIPGLMKRDAASGYPLRNVLRRVLGMEPTDQPASWAPGGDWDRERALQSQQAGLTSDELDQTRSDLDASLGGGRTVGRGIHLGADVTFNNVPPGVRTDAQGDGLDEFTLDRSSAFAGAP